MLNNRLGTTVIPTQNLLYISEIFGRPTRNLSSPGCCKWVKVADSYWKSMNTRENDWKSLETLRLSLLSPYSPGVARPLYEQPRPLKLTINLEMKLEMRLDRFSKTPSQTVARMRTQVLHVGVQPAPDSGCDSPGHLARMSQLAKMNRETACQSGDFRLTWYQTFKKKETCRHRFWKQCQLDQRKRNFNRKELNRVKHYLSNSLPLKVWKLKTKRFKMIQKMQNRKSNRVHQTTWESTSLRRKGRSTMQARDG